MDPTAAPRPHRELLVVVLAIIGGAAWLAGPLAFIEDLPRSGVPLAAIAGCLLGSASVAAVARQLPRLTAVVGGVLAGLLVLGLLVVWDQLPADALVSKYALVVAAAALAADVGATAGRLLPRGRVVGITWALVSLSVTVGALVVVTALVRLGLSPFALLGALVLAPLAGGVLIAILGCDARAAAVARAWLELSLAAAALTAIASGSLKVLVGGLVFAMTMGPLAAGLTWLGATLYRRYQPTPTAPSRLPVARVRR